MIGYLAGKYLSAEENSVIVDVGGVGYSVLVSSRNLIGLVPGSPIELFVHTNLRENALELFGFASAWEKKVFQLLTSVSGVGPRTALTILNGLDGETILSAIVREDRATLGSVSGVGKKTAERLLIELGDKARKLLAERPRVPGSGGTAVVSSQTAADLLAAQAQGDAAAAAGGGKKSGRGKKAAAGDIPPQGASAMSAVSGVDIADLWNEAVAALANLGYREADAITAIRMASNRATEAGEDVSLEKLIKASLQLMSRGMTQGTSR